MTKSNFVNAYYFFFVFVLIWLFVESIITGFPKEDFGLTEMLINYRGGFVRRGLFGEALLRAYELTGISPYYVLTTSCGLAYLSLIFFFVRSFIKKSFPLFILPFVFFLGNPVINTFWVRKDSMLLLLFILITKCALKKGWKAIIMLNLFLVAALLIHESIGFFCFPILGLILLKRDEQVVSRQGLLNIASQLLPSIIAFFLVLFFSGSGKVATAIWDSWRSVSFPIQTEGIQPIPGAIDGISWTIKEALTLTYRTLINFDGGVYAPIAWMLIILLIYYLLTNINKLNVKIWIYEPSIAFNKKVISEVLLWQFICVLPLFVIGWDYSRWVFLWVCTSFILLILVPKEVLEELVPERVSKISIKLNSSLSSVLGSSRSFLVLLTLVIGVPGCGWKLLNYVYTSSAGIVIQSLSTILRVLVSSLEKIL